MMELFEVGGMAATLVAAYEGCLLQALLNDCTTPAVYAEELGLNPRATKHILDILVSMGIADCNEGRYGASAARQLAVHLSGQPTHILDIGAGSGIWSLAMAERSLQTRVTALDFPQVLQAFHAQAEDMGLAHRIDTIAGDFHTVNIPANCFDCIILANVLHLEPPEQASTLIYRVRPGLSAGGKLVIVDVIGDGPPERERSRAFYALHLALRTEQGRAHTLSQLQQWVRQAGLIPADVIDLTMPHGLGALVASCPVRP